MKRWNWPWWRVVDHITMHNITIHNTRIRSGGIDLDEEWWQWRGGDEGKCDDGKWWRREVVTMGSGDEGKWWRREVMMKGSDDEGEWWGREVVRKGSGDEGKWWRREVMRKGNGEEGRGGRWEVVRKGSSEEGEVVRREVVRKGSGRREVVTMGSGEEGKWWVGEEARARNLVFFRVKWLQATMKGTSSVRRLRLRSFCARIVPPMCFATSGCSCVRSCMRFLNLWLQIALEWLLHCRHLMLPRA